MDTFFSRLKWAAHGRALTPWLQGLGWSNGVIGPLKRGRVPGPEKLEILFRVEGLSADWLLTGVGTPYPVRYCPGASVFREGVRDFAPHPAAQWFHHLLGAGHWLAVCLDTRADRPGPQLAVWAGAIPASELPADALVYEIDAGLAQQLALGSAGIHALVVAINADPLRAMAPVAAARQESVAYGNEQLLRQQRWQRAGEALRPHPADFEDVIRIAERFARSARA